jgi:hypothetical protein
VNHRVNVFSFVGCICSLSNFSVCHCIVKAAAENMETYGYGCDVTTLWAMKFESDIIFSVTKYSFLWYFQPFKYINFILSSQATPKQAEGWVWSLVWDFLFLAQSTNVFPESPRGRLERLVLLHFYLLFSILSLLQDSQRLLASSQEICSNDCDYWIVSQQPSWSATKYQCTIVCFITFSLSVSCLHSKSFKNYYWVCLKTD